LKLNKISDVIGDTTKEHFTNLKEICDERPALKRNLLDITTKMVKLNDEIEHHRSILIDPNGEEYILNNKQLVCGCERVCNCQTKKLTTTKQIDFVT
jgi:hypothetical protein